MVKKRIVITGAFGFIGSNLVEFLNRFGIVPHVYVNPSKLHPKNWKNLVGLKFELTEDLMPYTGDILVHLAASVDTTEEFSENLYKNNYVWPKKLIETRDLFQGEWSKVIYASSAAVYGKEESDFTERLNVKPINAYAFTKWLLDVYAETPPPHSSLYGLRFFNVYGPREDFKGDMKSVISKMLLDETRYVDFNVINLFKSYRDEIKHGEQKRDFVFVDDVCRVIKHFIDNDVKSGTYNVGSGKARSFNDLARIIHKDMEIKYIDMPQNLREHYQYFTQASLDKLAGIGYDISSFKSLEYGIEETKKYYESKNS